MSILRALAWFLADILAFFWYTVFEPPTNDPNRAAPKRSQFDETRQQALSDAPEHAILVPSMYRRGEGLAAEDLVNESSFLSQLEQRTQQVKITLANLEAEKVRIEGLISQLQPVVPHYDALLDAERAIARANVAIEEARLAPESQPEQSWEQQHEPQHQTAESAWGQ